MQVLEALVEAPFGEMGDGKGEKEAEGEEEEEEKEGRASVQGDEAWEGESRLRHNCEAGVSFRSIMASGDTHLQRCR